MSKRAEKRREDRAEEKKKGISQKSCAEIISRAITEFMKGEPTANDCLAMIFGMHHLLGMMKSALHNSTGLLGKDIQGSCIKTEMEGFEHYRRESGAEPSSGIITPSRVLVSPSGRPIAMPRKRKPD